MHKHCPIAWPTLPDFVQLALNIEAKVARSDVEVMIQMYEKSKQYKQGAVDWGKIEVAAAQALPACVSMIPQVSIFLQTYPGELLYGMAEWLSTIHATTAMVGKDFLEAINSIKIPTDMPIIRLPYALIKAQKISPTVTDGIGKAISVAKVKALSSLTKKPVVQQCEQHIQTAYNIVETLKLDPNKSKKLLGHLEVRVAAFVTEAHNVFENVEWASLDDIAKVRG